MQNLIIFIISSNTILAQNPSFFTPQYTEPETNNLIVTCPGKSGSMIIEGGENITKPLKFINPSSGSTCFTDYYKECQETGASFKCSGGEIDGLCPAGQMGNLDECVETPSGFYRSGGGWADSVKL